MKQKITKLVLIYKTFTNLAVFEFFKYSLHLPLFSFISLISCSCSVLNPSGYKTKLSFTAVYFIKPKFLKHLTKFLSDDLLHIILRQSS